MVRGTQGKTRSNLSARKADGKIQSDNHPVSLTKEWARLPQWEQEIRLLLFLSFTMPHVGPPSGIVDTGAIKSVFRADSADKNPWIDPATVRIHPYVKDKYLYSADHQQTAEALASCALHQQSGRLRVYPPVLISVDRFRSGGLFTQAYKSVNELIGTFEEVISDRLEQLRNQSETIEPDPANLQAIIASRIPTKLRVELASLARNEIDIAWLFSVFFYAANASLEMLAFYRSLEERQADLRAKIRIEKRSLRSHMAYWKQRLRPDAFERLEMEVGEILASFDLILQPSDQEVREYRRLLGIYRRGIKIDQQGFWTNLVGWAVPQLTPT